MSSVLTFIRPISRRGQVVVPKMEVLVRAQRLRADTALGARDCLHAATALLAGATTFLSEDTDFDRVPGLTRQPA